MFYLEDNEGKVKKLRATLNVATWICGALLLFNLLLFFCITISQLISQLLFGVIFFIFMGVPLLIGSSALMSSVIMYYCKDDFEILLEGRNKDSEEM